jgi:hypothetical protein
MDQAVSRWPLTVEAGAHSQSIPCGICFGQRGTGLHFFLRAVLFSRISINPPMFHAHNLVVYHRRCIIFAGDSVCPGYRL